MILELNVTAKRLAAFLLHIPQVKGSNLGPETSYPDMSFFVVLP
jgi:hypothetical protein